MLDAASAVTNTGVPVDMFAGIGGYVRPHLQHPAPQKAKPNGPVGIGRRGDGS